ncbi:MAG: Ni/Fe hydrogenase subunit alpha [gamma proteobacterium symbiont of Taylorina sp.]|nr:Ni/Fe hydrogenase subunit alpha [gamma proteobacterium symbiont of Taylorina sp.]
MNNTKIDVNIDIKHLTRVEGHGNIIVNVSNGKIEKCQWQVPESPRFFEAMVRGRHYSEVARITSRICGICSIGHTLASVKATEAALGIIVSEQTSKLRQLLKHAENFDSNVLHVYILAAPDLLGAKSVFPLIQTHTDIIRRALNLKRLAHEWGSAIAGRTTHPTTVVPGGFSKLPDIQALKELKQKLTAAIPDLAATVETILSITDQIPDFNRPTEYISLSNDNNYAIYDGHIQSILSDGYKQRYPVADYLSITNEYVSQWSTAKYCKNKLDSYMVGALARLNNNYAQLKPQAKLAAEKFNLSSLCTNPYMNTIAQVVELVNDVYTSLELLDDIISHGIHHEILVEPEKYGQGIASVEVPRGILFHDYQYTEDGLCSGGNFVIPTNQNHANIQYDFEKLLPELLEQNKTEAEIELALEMLVRAYDPCISCSAHYLKVKFV